jgi:transcriptional regulator with XRE-family HTH domain
MRYNHTLIKEIRAELSYSQRRFARNLGVSQAFVHYLETGAKPIPVWCALKLLTITDKNYSLDDFYFPDEAEESAAISSNSLDSALAAE